MSSMKSPENVSLLGRSTVAGQGAARGDGNNRQRKLTEKALACVLCLAGKQPIGDIGFLFHREPRNQPVPTVPSRGRRPSPLPHPGVGLLQHPRLPARSGGGRPELPLPARSVTT